MKTSVSFAIVEPTDFLSRENYESLGFTASYRGNELVALNLVVEHGIDAGHDQIVEEARERMKPLLTLIQFGRGIPLTLGKVDTQAIDPPSPVAIGLAFHKADVVIERKIPLPPKDILSRVTPEVLLQLGWHNKAGETAWAIDKIKNYYKVLELENRFSKHTPEPYQPPEEMRWLRNAVSHPKVDSVAIKSYLQQHIGSEHIDPNNATHLQFLEAKIDLLRRETESILFRKVPKWW